MVLLHSFLWLNNIPSYIYAPHQLYPFLGWWILRVLPGLSYFKWGFYEHWGACVIFSYSLLWIYAYEWKRYCFYMCTLISHASKVMLKILQARLQQYVNHELPDVQSGFRKGRETRDQIANIHWIIKKARKFQKNIYFCFMVYAKAFDYVDHNKMENSEGDGNIRPPDLSLEKPVCRSGSNS